MDPSIEDLKRWARLAITEDLLNEVPEADWALRRRPEPQVKVPQTVDLAEAVKVGSGDGFEYYAIPVATVPAREGFTCGGDDAECPIHGRLDDGQGCP